MRQIVKALAVALLLTTVWTSAAQAAPEWYTCVVELTGTGDHNFEFFRLSDTAAGPAFTAKWFRAPETVKKEYLAIALTAMSLDKKVFVRTDLFEETFPTIKSMYLVR